MSHYSLYEVLMALKLHHKLLLSHLKVVEALVKLQSCRGGLWGMGERRGLMLK